MTVVCIVYGIDLHSFWLAFNSVFRHTPVLVLALGIGIGIGQYYWVLGAFFGIVLTLFMDMLSEPITLTRPSINTSVQTHLYIPIPNIFSKE